VNKQCIGLAVSINLASHRYGKLTCHMGFTCHPAEGESSLYPQPKEVLDLAILKECEAKLSWPKLRESGPAGNWTYQLNLSIARPTPYRSVNKQHLVNTKYSAVSTG